MTPVAYCNILHPTLLMSQDSPKWFEYLDGGSILSSKALYRNSPTINIWAMKSALYVWVLHLQTAIRCFNKTDCPKDTAWWSRPLRVALMDPLGGFTDEKGVGRTLGCCFVTLWYFIDLQNTQPQKCKFLGGKHFFTLNATSRLVCGSPAALGWWQSSSNQIVMLFIGVAVFWAGPRVE